MLPVSTLSAVVFPPLLLEDQDFSFLVVLKDLGGNGYPRHQRGPNLHGSVSDGEEHIRKSKVTAFIPSERFNAKQLSWSDTILFSTCTNNCVWHAFSPM